MNTDSGLPGWDALVAVCNAFGLDSPDGAILLHHRSNAVWLLPNSIVVRLSPDTELRRVRATAAITVTRWLASADLTVALPPLAGLQPVITGGAVATLWPYRPSDHPATATDLGVLIRRLHSAGDPPPTAPIPPYRPLRRLYEALNIDTGRINPALPNSDRIWLKDRADQLVAEFDSTDFPLGIGLIHGDAHSENAVLDHNGWVLIDWDNTAIGPRELDLISGLPDHFHETSSDRTQFAKAYGYDLLDWPGWVLLRDIAELHSVGSYIRLAPDKPSAAAELRRRVHSLRTGDRSVVWRAIG
ncbi:aminoglycoside phosphotransferase family protein [Nocardia sp. NEAU-G5]|uniref:Aminoglycoside phosphotransferase family protein n=1 Tax=Nocardia albiluteola TaxID=2842303 RepID=A0ABS6AYM2_9NOCA|nr:aminoglycoside phosphotransferase family protein [Nocardia albiluteola]MBU3063139.1 aminoglycoside phosphotransferase family protein [Nocardia albiluteola]